MTRSFGDNIAREIGKTAEPEIKVRKLTEIDQLLIIASDGIWEFISNNEAVSMVHPFLKDGRPEMASSKHSLLTKTTSKRTC